MNGNPRGKTTWAGVFRFGKKAASVGSKIILGLLTCAVLLVFFKATTRAPAAKADSSVYYPSFCLGGWQNPQNASGQSDLPTGDTNSSDFTTNNSAFLASSVASQIFCGYFPVDGETNPPSVVTIMFNWSDGSSETPAPQSVPTVQTGSTGNTAPQNSGNQSSSSGSLSSSSGLEVATSTGFIVSTSTPDDSTSSDNTDSDASSSSSDSDATSPAPAATPAPSDDGSSDSSDPAASSSPTSFLYKVLDAFAKTASADDSGFASSNAFFQISYSTDGVNWIPAGTVSSGNFVGYSITVPVSSWDDLKNLQIKIDTLPTIVQKPDVYLESIALNVAYNGSLVDDASSTIAAVGTAIDATAAAIDAALTQPTAPALPPPPPAPVMTLEKKVSFDFNGTAETATTRNLPWYPRDFLKAAMQHPFDSQISLRKNHDGSSLVVSGICNASDYVVLIYRNPTDYINHPASFLYDAAEPCNPDGTYSVDLASLSLNIPNGTYNLLIGSEGGAGTWVPISPVVPITIDSQNIEVPVAASSTTQ